MSADEALMRTLPLASVAAIGVLLQALAQGPPATLLTVPMRDAWQSTAGPSAVGVSADGRHVAFASYAQLVPADTNDRVDIYVLDRTTGRVTLESPRLDPMAAGPSTHPRLSGDGRYLVFQTTVATEDHFGIGADVALRDRLHDAMVWASGRSAGRVPNGSTRNPSISEDGRIVVFQSEATNLVAGPDENGAREDVYAFEAATGDVRRVSVDNAGRQRAEGASFMPSISGDGRYVAFTSTADLDDGPAGRMPGPAKACAGPPCPSLTRIYVRDIQLGTTRVASVGARGQIPDDSSCDPAISRDGRYVAFTSMATNLTPGDRNRSADVFVRDMRAGSTVLISRGANGGPANGSSSKPAISADGRFVAFESEASNLICAKRCARALDDINLLSDVFLFDRDTGLTRWISESPSGGWIEESGPPQVDAAGEVVAFPSRHPIDEGDTRNDFDLFIYVAGQQMR